MNVWPGGIILKFCGLFYEKPKEKEETGVGNTSAKRFCSTSNYTDLDIITFVMLSVFKWNLLLY